MGPADQRALSSGGVVKDERSGSQSQMSHTCYSDENAILARTEGTVTLQGKAGAHSAYQKFFFENL